MNFYESYDLPLDLGGRTPWEYLMENHRGAILFEPQVSQIYWTWTRN